MKKNIGLFMAVAACAGMLVSPFANPVYAVAKEPAYSFTARVNDKKDSTSKIADGNYYTSSVDSIDKSQKTYAQCDDAKISGQTLKIHASLGNFDTDKVLSVRTRKFKLVKKCKIQVGEVEGAPMKNVSKKKFNKWFAKGSKDRMYCSMEIVVKKGKVIGIYMGP